MGPSNKIFQISFELALQPIFPATKVGHSENKKLFLCEKNPFLCFGQVRKLSLRHITGNGQKILHYLDIDRNPKGILNSL